MNTEQRRAEDAVREFAAEWVDAFSPVVNKFPAASRQRTDARRTFIRAVAGLQANYTHQIRFTQILNALANCISKKEHGQCEPLCELFTYFMQGHPNAAAYADFDFQRSIARRSAG
jgi:hypothetical protein